MQFYLADITKKYIQKPESEHLISCRIKVGEIINITNLKGQKAIIKITVADLKKGIFEYEILELEQLKKPVNQNILIQAQPDKLYLEKICEILPLAKVDKIVIFSSDFSQKQNINLDRLERILIRSCEQCHSNFKPDIQIITSRHEIEEIVGDLKPVVLEIPIGEQADVKKIQSDHNAILVGPEGGWSDREIKLFNSHNLKFQSLGNIVYPAWIAGFVWFSRL